MYALSDFFPKARYPYYRTPYYRYAPCRDLTFSDFVICAALMVADTPISPRKHLAVISSSTVLPRSHQEQPAQFRCVFPYFLLISLSVVDSQAPS